MARPKTKPDDLREQLLTEAELMLAQTNGRRLVLSELSQRVGISQSYAHRFFATKADLIRALAQRWFEHIEAASAAARTAPGDPKTRIETWCLTILRQKRDRYDQDPALYEAYLALAADHMDLVGQHVARLEADAKAIMADIVAEPEPALQVFLDATHAFRTPLNIARYRAAVTDARASAVIRAVLDRL